MTHRTVSVDDIIELNNDEHVVLHIGVNDVTVRDVDTGEYRTVTLAELADLTPVDDSHTELSFVDMQRATQDELEAARRLAGHIEEILTGKHPDHEQLDPAYGPSKTMAERDQAKSDQLTRTGTPISVRSLRRKRRLYSASPVGRNLGALLDGRRTRTDDPWGSIPDVYITAIKAEVRARRDATTTSGRPVRAAVMERVEKAEPTLLKHPAQKTLDKWIRLVDTERVLFGTARNRHSRSVRPVWMWRSREAIAPGHEVQMDSSQFDILCRGRSGRVIRASLVAMIDKRTRTVLVTGVYVSNAGIDLVHLLGRALRPRPARISRFHFTDVEVPLMPWSKKLTEDQRAELDARVPFIYPQRIIVDNGGDYRSEVFRSACAEFGIDLSFAPIGSPTYKAIIEHFFDIVASLFAERIPGYIARETAHRRRRDPDPDTLLSIDELADLFEEWVTIVWQNRVHGGLRDPRNSTRELTPNAMYIAATDVTDAVPLPISNEQYLTLLPIEFRTIRPDGIEFHTYRYDSEELGPLRGRPSGDRRHQHKWEIRWDHWDNSAIWVRDTVHDRWIECEKIGADPGHAPMAVFLRRRQRATLKNLPQFDNDAASGLVADVIKALPETQARAVAEEQRRDRALAERDRSKTPRTHRGVLNAEPAATTRFDPNDYVAMDAFDPEGDL